VSEENVEIVRQVWKVLTGRGLETALESYSGWYAEECVFEDFPEMPDRAIYRGREGVRLRTTHFADTWGDFVMEPREFIDVGDHHVVAVIDMTGHGKGSGAPLDAQAVFVYDFESGLIVRDRAFTSRDQAFEAAGIQK